VTLPPTGRRPRTAPVGSGVLGWVLTVHLQRPIGAGRPRVAQAQHWTGWCAADGLDRVLKELEAGTHCRIMREAVRLGIAWDLAGIERGDRNRERQLKQRSASRRCPICQAQRKLRKSRAAAA
jgi:hypothetical protein